MFDVSFLGSGASAPSVARGFPALLVRFGSNRVLVDCGEGTQRQILRNGLGFRRLNRVLLTHGHLDHILGLPGLAATLGMLGTGDGLAIHAGTAILDLVRNMLFALWRDAPPIPLQFAPLAPGTIFSCGTYRVGCFPVRHRNTDSFGFSFETAPRRPLLGDRLSALEIPPGPIRGALAAGRSVILDDGRRIAPEDVLGPVERGRKLIVIGDAEEVTSLTPIVRGADALIIEATFLEADRETARRYGHLTAADAARLAAAAEVQALYLTHISTRYQSDEIEAEAQRLFVNTKVVSDLDQIAVPSS